MVEATLALADRYTTTTSTPTVDGFASDDKKGDFLADMFVDPNDTGENYVLFSTVHRAKGLERKTVHIITDRMTIDSQGKERISPCFMLPWSMNNEAEIDQELNAVYVCITRAMTTQRYYTNTPDASTVQHALWMLNSDDISMGQWPVENDEEEAAVAPALTPVVDESTVVIPVPADTADMPQFACLLNGTIQHLTDDDDLAFAFMLEHADEDWDHTAFALGDVVNGATVQITLDLQGAQFTLARQHWIEANADKADR